jgi:DNA-binding GntR family transcriptional regulator
VALADRLDMLNEQMARAIAQGGSALPERVQEINAQFHRAVLEASGSPRLRGMLASLIDMPIVIRSHFISTPEDKLQSLQHHRELATAVRLGDAELARQVMQLHLRVAAHRFKLRRSEFSDASLAAAAPGRRRTGGERP